MKVVIDGSVQEAKAGELLIDRSTLPADRFRMSAIAHNSGRFRRVTHDGESELPTGASLRNPNHRWNPAVGI